MAFFAIDVIAKVISRYVTDSFEVNCQIADDFIQQYCKEDLPNFAKYFEVIVFSEIAAFFVLQYFWSMVFTGNPEHFLASIKALESLQRDGSTGEYNLRDLEIIRKLKRRMSKPGLYWGYLLLHLFPQIIVAVVYFGLASIFRADSIVFTCQNPGSGVWPQDISNATCIAPSITTLEQLQYINYIILGCIFFALLWGFFYVLIVPGFDEKIAHENVAEFVVFTGLRPQHFRNYNHFNPCKWLSQRIFQNDLQFLMLRLYTTNRKCAEAIEAMLIEKEVYVINEEFCHCSNEYHKMKTEQGSRNAVINSIFSIAKQVKEQRNLKLFGILITHESESMAYTLDKLHFTKTICFNFNPHLLEWGKKPKMTASAEPKTNQLLISLDKMEDLETNQPPMEDLKTKPPPLTRYHHHSDVPNIMQIPSHIWSWASREDDHTKVENEVTANMNDLIKNAEDDFELLVILTPISDKEFGRVHADHRIKHLLRYIPKAAKNISVLTYIPTLIGGHKTEEEFASVKDRDRIPPFLHDVDKDESTTVHSKEYKHKHWHNIKQSEVSGTFGGVKCEFRVNVYKYQNQNTCQSSAADNMQEHSIVIQEENETKSHETFLLS